MVQERSAIYKHLYPPTERTNFIEYIDYSTPPFPDTPSIIQPFMITDVSSTIGRYMRFNNMVRLYQVFPLHDMIEMLLSVSIKNAEIPGLTDRLLFYVEERMGSMMEKIDIDSLFIFFEGLTQELELEIARKSPDYFCSGHYVFYKWVDPISICLCLEKDILPMGKTFILGDN